MKRLLTLLVLAALLGFTMFKAGVWWLADQRLAEVRQALSDTGVLERGRISSGVEGSLVLSEASWQDFELTQPLLIGRAEFETDSPIALLKALMDPSGLPASWTLQAEGLALALEATMFRNWVTAGSPEDSGQVALFTLSCAPDLRQRLGSGDLLRMGVTRLKGQLSLSQTPEQVHLELNTENTGSLELTWPGARINLLSPESALTGIEQPFEITFRDGGLMRRVAAYCARETGMETTQWAGQVLEAFEAGLKARGWHASDQLLALYRQWLLEGGEITATGQMGSDTFGIPVRSDDENAESSAAWALEYNGARVPDVFLRKAEPVVATPPKEALEPVVPQEDPAVTQWYTEDPEQAANWMSHRVRVLLSNGNVVEGRLSNVTERELDVARTIAGGEVAYPIAVRAIESFEVWRRGQTP